MLALRKLTKGFSSCRARSSPASWRYPSLNHLCTKQEIPSSNPVHDMRMPKISPPLSIDVDGNAPISMSDENISRPDSYIEMNIDRGELGGGYDSLLKENNAELNEEQMKEFKEPLTPLAKELITYIKNRGPLSINEFMTQALTHNIHGYYQNKINENKIGSRGDFITSPEISPLFGEMVAIWCVNMWGRCICCL